MSMFSLLFGAIELSSYYLEVTIMEKEFEKIAMRVSYVSILANVFLTLFKMIAGIVAHSGAMISDAVHSASDVFSTFVVIIGIRMAAKESDKEHPYGHERMECVAAIVLAVLLCLTGFGIGRSAILQIIGKNTMELKIPGVLAMIAAIVSIFVKEAMYWYTRASAKRIDSGALMADAWHHRSDALSSIGALVGIIFARRGYPIMDSVASLFICFFIVKVAYEIFIDSVDKMVDKACDEQTENELREFVLEQPGVEGVDLLATRVFGNKIYVDLEIGADGEKTLNETHEIAEHVHDEIELQFPKVKHIMIHVNPVKK